MTIITIKGVPSLQRITRNLCLSASTLKMLTHRQLANRYGLILACEMARQRGRVICYKVSDNWIIHNALFYKSEIEKELKARGVFEEYTFFIEQI